LLSVIRADGLESPEDGEHVADVEATERKYLLSVIRADGLESPEDGEHVADVEATLCVECVRFVCRSLESAAAPFATRRERKSLVVDRRECLVCGGHRYADDICCNCGTVDVRKVVPC